MQTQSALALLSAGRKVAFDYEKNCPFARPIPRGLRAAVAQLRRRGRRIEYSLELRHGFFIYLVQAK